jgi:MerR family copper efflux transcriptional regulator
MDNFKSYLRIKEAAAFIGVSESTLRNWGRNGKIPTYRHPINRYRLYKKGDLDALLREIKRVRDNIAGKRSFGHERT